MSPELKSRAILTATLPLSCVLMLSALHPTASLLESVSFVYAGASVAILAVSYACLLSKKSIYQMSYLGMLAGSLIGFSALIPYLTQTGTYYTLSALLIPGGAMIVASVCHSVKVYRVAERQKREKAWNEERERANREAKERFERATSVEEYRPDNRKSAPLRRAIDRTECFPCARSRVGNTNASRYSDKIIVQKPETGQDYLDFATFAPHGGVIIALGDSQKLNCFSANQPFYLGHVQFEVLSDFQHLKDQKNFSKEYFSKLINCFQSLKNKDPIILIDAYGGAVEASLFAICHEIYRAYVYETRHAVGSLHLMHELRETRFGAVIGGIYKSIKMFDYWLRVHPPSYYRERAAMVQGMLKVQAASA